MTNKNTIRKGVEFLKKTLTVVLVGAFLFTPLDIVLPAGQTNILNAAEDSNLAPALRLDSEEFKASLTVAAICKHIEHDGSLDDKSYLNDVLARLDAGKNPNIAVLPYEIIIEIPAEGLVVRYFDPAKATVITPYSDISKLSTKEIGPRLNRQIIHRIKALPLAVVNFKQLIIVPGHGVYVGKKATDTSGDDKWVGIFPGEGSYYTEHARVGVELAAKNPEALLVFSGGQTREPAGRRSEAESYFDIASQWNWWGYEGVQNRTVLESFARDSLENVLFSVLLFKERAGYFPDKVTVVGWKFKKERFLLHSQALGIPSGIFDYIEANNPEGGALQGALKGEEKKVSATKKDMLLEGAEWEEQRTKRNPFNEKSRQRYLADKNLNVAVADIRGSYELKQQAEKEESLSEINGATQICEAFKQNHIIPSYTAGRDIVKPGTREIADGLASFNRIFDISRTKTRRSIEASCGDIDSAKAIAASPLRKEIDITYHVKKVGETIINLAKESIGAIEDPNSELYQIIKTLKPEQVSLHLGWSAEEIELGTEQNLLPDKPLSPVLERDILLDRITKNLITLQKNLKKAGYDKPILIETLNYCDSGAYEHVTEPGFVKEVLKRTGARLLIDCAHVLVSAKNRKDHKPEEYMEYMKALVNEETIGLVDEIHLSVPEVVSPSHYKDMHSPLYSDTVPAREVREILRYILMLRAEKGITRPITINLETGVQNADREIILLSRWILDTVLERLKVGPSFKLRTTKQTPVYPVPQLANFEVTHVYKGAADDIQKLGLSDMRKTVHFMIVDHKEKRVMLNLCDPEIRDILSDPTLYEELKKLKNINLFSLHLGFSMEKVEEIPGGIKGSLTLPDQEIRRRIVENVKLFKAKLKENGFGDREVLLENMAYFPGLDYIWRPDTIRDMLRDTECGLLLDLGHLIVTAQALKSGIDGGGIEKPSEYMQKILDKETVAKLREVHISIPAYIENERLWVHGGHRGTPYGSLYEDTPGTRAVKELLFQILDLRKRAGIKSELIINIETDDEHASKDAVRLAEILKEWEESNEIVSGVAGNEIAKNQMEYIDTNKLLFKDALGEGKQDILLRVPIEAIESIGVDSIKDFLATFQKAPNGYVELYYMSGTGEASENTYQRYGIGKKLLSEELKIPEKRTRKNTLTLFPVLKDEKLDQSSVVSRIGNMKPKNTILSPIGLQNDSAGLIRSTVLGLKIMEVAREGEKIDKDKVQIRVLEDLKMICKIDDMRGLTADDIIYLAISDDINKIIEALKKLIRLLPIMPIDAEELRQIYEHAKQALIAA